MYIWIWAVVAIVAIVGSFYLEFQKNKMKMMKLGERNEEGVEDLHKTVGKLIARVENLEAIASGEPETFKKDARRELKEIEIKESEIKEENQQKTSKIANDLRS